MGCRKRLQKKQLAGRHPLRCADPPRWPTVVCCETSPHRWAWNNGEIPRHTPQGKNGIFELIFPPMRQTAMCEPLRPKSQVPLAKPDRYRAWFSSLLSARNPRGATFTVLWLAACSSGPRAVTVPTPLVGKWFGQNSGDSIEFTDSGVFVLELRGIDPLIGRCVFKGTRITLRYQLGSIICPEEPGEYTLELDGPSLIFNDAVDTCNTRKDALSQSWRRSVQG